MIIAEIENTHIKEHCTLLINKKKVYECNKLNKDWHQTKKETLRKLKYKSKNEEENLNFENQKDFEEFINKLKQEQRKLFKDNIEKTKKDKTNKELYQFLKNTTNYKQTNLQRGNTSQYKYNILGTLNQK